jgi:hypothetical protein
LPFVIVTSVTSSVKGHVVSLRVGTTEPDEVDVRVSSRPRNAVVSDLKQDAASDRSVDSLRLRDNAACDRAVSVDAQTGHSAGEREGGAANNPLC